MKVIYAEEFRKHFRKLPQDVQNFYRRQEEIFKKNWRDPRLHVRKLHGHLYPFSFRITRNWRVLFTFIDFDLALFATIGNRKDIYK